MAKFVAVDLDGARYCLDCAPNILSSAVAEPTAHDVAEHAEREGIGGPVLAGNLEGIEHCDNCGALLDDA